MIINQSTILTEYIVKSPRLKHDVFHIKNIPLSSTSKWKPEMLMQRLVDAGLAQVASKYVDGSIAEIRADGLTLEQVEAACLTPEDVERIDAWIKKGIVR